MLLAFSPYFTLNFSDLFDPTAGPRVRQRARPLPPVATRSSGAGALWGDCRRKAEEGGGHGRSACPETPGLHAGYNGGDSGTRPREGKAIPQTPP